MHTSGIGDYFDGDDGGLRARARRTSQLFAPGEREKYCNAGYVVLALLAERASGRSFYDLVDEHVCGPAGMTATAFLRSDSLPGTAAIGYLEDGRTNVFHLPVRGSGDGGIYTTFDDIDRFEQPGCSVPFARRSLATWLPYSTPVISNTTHGAWPVARALR